ncbi:MAG: hypothetical protein ACI4XN_07315 [Candidatus Kurthia intestinigallinarum]
MLFNKYKVNDEKYNNMCSELLTIDNASEYNAKVAGINEYAASIGIKNRQLSWEELYGNLDKKLTSAPKYNGLLMIWEKYGKKRGYLTESAIEKALGLEVERYKSGNAKYVTQDGYEISNSQYNRIIVRFVNQYFDFISKKWSFELKEDNEKRIDDFFRNSREIC